MKVTLDYGEFSVARMLATLRSAVNRTSGVADQRVGKTMNGIDMDEIGLIAEIAFAKYHNVYPDLTISPRKGSPDLIIGGKKIDVKATTVPNGKLLASLSKKPNEVDLYVLGIVNGMTVDFVGYATSKEIINPRTIRDLGHGEGYCLEQKQLHKFAVDIEEAA